MGTPTFAQASVPPTAYCNFNTIQSLFHKTAKLLQKRPFQSNMAADFTIPEKKSRFFILSPNHAKSPKFNPSCSFDLAPRIELEVGDLVIDRINAYKNLSMLADANPNKLLSQYRPARWLGACGT